MQSPAVTAVMSVTRGAPREADPGSLSWCPSHKTSAELGKQQTPPTQASRLQGLAHSQQLSGLCESQGSGTHSFASPLRTSRHRSRQSVQSVLSYHSGPVHSNTLQANTNRPPVSKKKNPKQNKPNQTTTKSTQQIVFFFFF